MSQFEKATAQSIVRFEKLMSEVLKEYPDVTPKKMFGYPCAFYNTHLFMGLCGGEFGILRLPQKDRQEFMETYDVDLFSPMGRPMREYPLVTAELMENVDEMMEWVHISLSYVGSLKPKPPKTSNKKK